MKLKELLKAKLPKSLLDDVPSSFDTIGTIAIFNKFSDTLLGKEKTIAEALLLSHNNLKTACIKTRKVSGTYRVPKLKIFAGERNFETVHKENGCLLRLDVQRCYFSPRLASERMRIASLIKKPEDILVLFSGVSPYPCVLAKNARVKSILAVELNKVAHRYAQENVKLNKLKNVELWQQDAGKAVQLLKKQKRRFDRIILPLPKDAHGYLEKVLPLFKRNGTIHLYQFCHDDQKMDIIKHYRKRFSSVKLIPCGAYSPHVMRVCLDLGNPKKSMSDWKKVVA